MRVDCPPGRDCQDGRPKNARTAQYHQIRTIRPQLFTTAWAIVVVHGMARDVRPGNEFSDPRRHRLTGNAREELLPLFGGYLQDLFDDEARKETPLSRIRSISRPKDVLREPERQNSTSYGRGPSNTLTQGKPGTSVGQRTSSQHP